MANTSQSACLTKVNYLITTVFLQILTATMNKTSKPVSVQKTVVRLLSVTAFALTLFFVANYGEAQYQSYNQPQTTQTPTENAPYPEEIVPLPENNPQQTWTPQPAQSTPQTEPSVPNAENNPPQTWNPQPANNAAQAEPSVPVEQEVALPDKEEVEENVIEDIAEDEIPEDKLPQEVYPATDQKETADPVEQTSSEQPEKTDTPADAPENDSEAKAESEDKPEEKPAIDSNALRVFQRIQSPRELVEFFLESAYKRNYDDASLTMDLSKLPSDTQDVEKYTLAYRLEQILIRLKNFSVEKIPKETDNDRYFLWPDRDFEAMVLVKQPDGAWKFGSATVANIDKNYALIENQPPAFVKKGWMKNIPESLFQPFWGMMYIQWIILLAFIVIGVLVYLIAPFLTVYLILMPLRFVKLGENYIELIKRALRPIAYLAMLYIWYYGLVYVRVAPNVIQWATWIMQPLGIVLVMVFLMRMCDVFTEWLRKRMVRSSNKTGNVLVELANRTLKCLMFFLGVIGIAQVFGFSALGIISGMGIGGIAVALAAQQTIANFFGSLTILLDRPFTVGDWIVVDGVEGSVETIGLRSTRIRTFYNSLIVIPNSSLATSVIDNMGRRLYRRYKTTLGVEYDTPVELMEAFCGGIRALIESYPNTRKDDMRVCVNDFADSSINILLVCFFIAHSAEEENAARQQLILDIIRLAKRLGVNFAFPSVTQYQIKQNAPTYPILTEIKNDQDLPQRFGAKVGEQIVSEHKVDDAPVV